MKTTTIALLAGLSFAAGSAAWADLADMDPITLRLAHVVNEQDSFHVAAERFRDIVEERSEGRITVELFPNATLGAERTLLEGMQIGSVDMGVITNGPVANFLEEMAVFELPFLFPSVEAAHAVLDGEIGQELLDRLQEVNLVGLGFAERGFRNITNSQREIREPSDLQGLRIRVIENPVYIAAFRELGANAIPMAWTEALTAMQQGTIDGQENPVGVVYSFGLNETQTHMTMTRHIYAPAVFVMGAPMWNRLPEAAQELVVEAAREGGAHARAFNAEMEASQLEALSEAGMAIIEDPDLSPFQEAVAPVFATYGERFGDYLARIQAAIDDLP